MEKLSDFIEKLENGVSYYYATTVIDELTQDERKKIHDMCVVKAAVSMTFPPQRDDLSRVAEYIRQNYIPTNEQPANNQQPNYSHFTTGLNRVQLTTIFEQLKNKRYLSADSVLNDWLILCGVEPTNRPVNKINWVKDQQVLGKLVEQLFDDANMWQITEQVFTVKGKIPNTNTIKITLSKIKNKTKDKPKSFEDLEKLLKAIF